LRAPSLTNTDAEEAAYQVIPNPVFVVKHRRYFAWWSAFQPLYRTILGLKMNFLKLWEQRA